MTIQELEQKLSGLKTEAKTLLNRTMAQARAEGRPMSAAESAGVQELIQQAEGVKKRLDTMQGDASMTAAIEKLTGHMAPPASSHGGGHTLGRQIMESEVGQFLLRHKGGRFPSGAWTSPSSELMAATLSEDSASGGALVLTDSRPGILALPTRPLVLADLIAPGTTDSNSISYMKETSIVNAAAPVLEGGVKPESTIAFDSVMDPVRKIATWVPVTEELLEDVSAMAAYLDTRLRHFVQLSEDDQLLNGNGTAPNISGLLDRVGLAASIARSGAQTNPDAILLQISAIETATSMAVDGIVLHPGTWDSLLLMKDADGNYIAGGGPFAAPQQKTLWGRKVAVTPSIAANTALVGAFRTASQFFRRGGLRVEASNSHSDFFVKNLVAIRAEERGALAVYRPSAFGTVTGLN